MIAQTTGTMETVLNGLKRRRIRAGVATFPRLPGFQAVKTFFKVLLLVIAAVIAVKLLPLTLGLGCLLGLALVALLAVGVSVFALLAGLAVFLVAVLAPIWLPVLAIIGLVALIKRANRRPAGA
jgi:hypothetical protein